MAAYPNAAPACPLYLGRVLRADGVPVGTCFQVRPGVLFTARHVLAEIGADHVDAEVDVDGLASGAATVAGVAAVAAVDPVHDLAVLTVEVPLPAVVGRLAPSRAVPARAEVVITGVPTIADDHGYLALTATGRWQGTAVREDRVELGRLESPAVVPGMSGAPVRLVEDDAVVGLLAARYNSADNWMRDSVWVVRSEDIARLARPVLGSVAHGRRLSGSATPVVMAISGSGESTDMRHCVGLALADAGLTEAPAESGDQALIIRADGDQATVLAGRFIRALADRAHGSPAAGRLTVTLEIATSASVPAAPQLTELPHLDEAVSRAGADARVVLVVSDGFFDRVIRQARGRVDAAKFLPLAVGGGRLWFHVPATPPPAGAAVSGSALGK
ncbi:trypsin-like peptidase domain-containing protein [Micromonospora chalcea]|uniref:trypsin-like peptidase domain-containing protein n=1 Tax=Micromonospora chalcea TaxID=1874 RepID=UPI0033C3BAC8